MIAHSIISTYVSRYELCLHVEFDDFGRAVNKFLPVANPPHHCHHELAVAWCSSAQVAAGGAAGDSATKQSTLAACIPFEHVGMLVRTRSTNMMLERGKAFVLTHSWREVFVSHFRSRLVQELAVARRVVPTLLKLEEGRLGRVLLAHAECMEAAAAAMAARRWMPPVGGGFGLPPLPLTDVDSRCVSFPPCMTAIMRELRG